MKLTILLADYAEALNGKLYVMGGGWSVTNPEPLPMALALKVEVPWDQSNRPHQLSIRLVDADGQAVEQDSPEGRHPIEMGADFEVGRPPGVKHGSPLDFALALNIQRGPLERDTRYSWVVYLDGETREEWSVSFSTRP